MSDDEIQITVEDPPVPDLDEVEQRDITGLPAVQVDVVGPVRIQPQPARIASTILEFLSSTPVQILAPDLRRSRAVLCSTLAWNYLGKRNGLALPWPANVPLEITHGGEVWASSGASAVLSVIVENYAQ